MHFLASLVFSSLVVNIHSWSDDQDVSARRPCPITIDNVVFCQPREHHLQRGQKLTTLSKLGKEWSVSFDFKPIESQLTEQANIIHLTILGGQDSEERITYGRRIVSIMTRPDQDLHFSMALTDQNGVERNWNSNFNGTQVDKWTNITISQQKVRKDEEECEKYVQTITIDGNQVFRRRNTGPEEFRPVNVFASSHNFPAQPGFIRNFVIQDGNTGDSVLSLALSCFVPLIQRSQEIVSHIFHAFL